MAGRDFGPPPMVVDEFDIIWREWLYLLFGKVYKRRNAVIMQAIDGIGDGNPSNTMAEGLIGIAPVIFAEDNKRQDQNFAWIIPVDWVAGTDFTYLITFANVEAQTGIKSVVVEINYQRTEIGEDLSLPGDPVFLTMALPDNVAANILHDLSIIITPSPDAAPGSPFQFELARDGQDAADTVTGDIGFKEIAIIYDAYINPN